MRSETWSNGTLREVETWDTGTGTYTRTDGAGTVLATRELTADEVASLTPAPDLRAELRAQIAAAESPAELQALLLQAIDMGVL